MKNNSKHFSLFLNILLFTLLFFGKEAFAINNDIRIGIIPSEDQVVISTSNRGSIFMTNGNELKEVLKIEPLQSCTIKNTGGFLEVIISGKREILTKQKLFLKNLRGKDKYYPLVYAKSKWYRGYIEIFPSQKNAKELTVVNVLPLEEYLYGVVPSEMPAGWPIESLKSQAIAARTYALSNINKYASLGYDLLATVESQVYQGLEAETPTTNKAVDDTKGKVLTYNKELITAFYYSCSGGITEDGEDAWGKGYPYIKSVTDYDQDSPKYTWYYTLSNQDIRWILKDKFNFSSGYILDIAILERTSSNRVKTIKITGTEGSIIIDGKKFRLSSKLNSTFFNVEPLEIGVSELDSVSVPAFFQFAGRGWGHGAGMSQWGARYLGKIGKTYNQILKHYYTDTEILSIEEVLAYNKPKNTRLAQYANR